MACSACSACMVLTHLVLLNHLLHLFLQPPEEGEGVVHQLAWHTEHEAWVVVVVPPLLHIKTCCREDVAGWVEVWVRVCRWGGGLSSSSLVQSKQMLLSGVGGG